MPDILVPTTTKELFDMMQDTPELCGKFELVGETIFWDLCTGIDIEISIQPPSTYFGIGRRLFGKIPHTITHWHPECEEVYDEVLNIGSEGNVLVIRDNILFPSVLYAGKEEECPYLPTTKWRFGRILYSKAKRTQ